ncbi:MAG: rod shape-determining protein RodA [Bacteroidota bacterium]
MEERSIFKKLDLWMVLIFLALLAIGWINIYASSYSDNNQGIFDFSQKYGKQLFWIIGSFVIALMIMIIDIKFFSAFSNIIYAIVLLMLVSVLVYGSAVAGSQSWFQIGDFKLQPSEFAKFATMLALAKYLGNINLRMDDPKTRRNAFFIILLPLALVLIQNDTGSAIVFGSFLFVLYREGLSGNILILGLILIALFLATLLVQNLVLICSIAVIYFFIWYIMRRQKKIIYYLVIAFFITSGFIFSVDFVFNRVLEKHQQDRVNVLLNKSTDNKGIGYNVNQSKIAIGSGGLFGRGFLQGTQTKYNFVPEQSTDFIFCTIGEEWGFVGSIITLLLFLALLLRITFLAEKQRSPFARVFGYGLASVLFFHVMANIGMTIGLVPVIGIPLPFIGYGGSSLFAFTIMLFTFIKMNSQRTLLL